MSKQQTQISLLSEPWTAPKRTMAMPCPAHFCDFFFREIGDLAQVATAFSSCTVDVKLNLGEFSSGEPPQNTLGQPIVLEVVIACSPPFWTCGSGSKQTPGPWRCTSGPHQSPEFQRGCWKPYQCCSWQNQPTRLNGHCRPPDVPGYVS